MTTIEILQIGSREYISLEDVAHYLGCSADQARDYVHLGKLRAEQIGSRWLIDWQSVKDFAEKRGQKRKPD
jgi:excisionase family DNA binding protein